jgi:hypothetical protein
MFINFFDFGIRYVIGRQFIKHYLPMLGNNPNVYLESFKLLNIMETFLFATKNRDEERVFCRASLLIRYFHEQELQCSIIITKYFYLCITLGQNIPKFANFNVNLNF